jgi:hypothetical protein
MDDLPDPLLKGLHHLRGVPHLKLGRKSDWRIHGDNLSVPVTVDLGLQHPAREIDRVTQWYLEVSTTYPFGRLRFYPAKKGGIVKTYPHQRRNSEHAERPWREGYPCLGPWGRVARHDLDEHYDEHRLVQRGQRLVQWLQAAEGGTLIQPDHPVEFPQVPLEPSASLAYQSQNLPTNRTWSQPGATGIATLFVDVNGKKTRFFLHKVQHSDGPSLVEWGEIVPRSKQRRFPWVVASNIPVIDPWQPIEECAELDRFLRRDGTSLANVLSGIPPGERTLAPTILLAAHTRKRHGDSPSLVTWHALQLEIPKNALSQWKRNPGLLAPRLIASQAKIKWFSGRDYRPSQHLIRGALADHLLDARVAIVGCGALGSLVAEALARGGTSDLILVDGDELAPGNLVRHTLTYSDLDHDKVRGLAQRLRAINPTVRVRAVPDNLPLPEPQEVLRDATVVLNLTGDAHARAFMADIEWNPETLLVTASLNPHARHLLLDVQRGSKWDLGQANALFNDNRELLLDGIEDAIRTHGEYGCWNPLFPAKHYEVTARAADLLRHLDQANPGLGPFVYPLREA